MDKNATIRSTGKARIWRLRSDRDALRDIRVLDLKLEAPSGG
jgi:hypothetical protein